MGLIAIAITAIGFAMFALIAAACLYGAWVIMTEGELADSRQRNADLHKQVRVAEHDRDYWERKCMEWMAMAKCDCAAQAPAAVPLDAKGGE